MSLSAEDRERVALAAGLVRAAHRALEDAATVLDAAVPGLYKPEAFLETEKLRRRIARFLDVPDLFVNELRRGGRCRCPNPPTFAGDPARCTRCGAIFV